MENFPTRHPPPPPSAKEAKDLSNLCSAACDLKNTFFGADNYPRFSGIKIKYDPVVRDGMVMVFVGLFFNFKKKNKLKVGRYRNVSLFSVIKLYIFTSYKNCFAYTTCFVFFFFFILFSNAIFGISL